MKLSHVWLCLLLLAAPVCSSADEARPAKALPTKLTFSYTSHPLIDKVLLPLVQQAYQNLGITVQFVAVESQRAQHLLKDGLVDGDVGRLREVANRIPNVVLVMKLEQLNLSLRCRPDVLCNTEDMNNPQMRVFMAAAKSTLALLELDYKAELYPLRDWYQINMMYQQNKIERFLWIEGTLSSSPIVDSAVVLPLETKALEVYHILHNSYSHLVPQVAAQLELLLAAYRAEHAILSSLSGPDHHSTACDALTDKGSRKLQQAPPAGLVLSSSCP